MEQFDKVFVINLKERKDRLDTFFEHYNTLGLNWNIEVFEAIKEEAPNWFRAPDGAWGCLQSHLKILEIFRKNKWKDILILEDDALFRSDFVERFDNLLVPNNWQMLYLGGQPLRREIVFNNCLSTCENINRTHAYAVRKGFEKYLIDVINNPPNPYEYHIDSRYGQICGYFKVYLCRPRLIGQDKGVSDINVKHRDYGIRFWDV